MAAKKAVKKTSINAYDVISTPVVTEKTMRDSQNGNKFTVRVAKDANKTQIKEAFEQIFNVKVVNVNTVNVRAKDKRVGRYSGKVGAYKKAIITLAEGQEVSLDK